MKMTTLLGAAKQKDLQPRFGSLAFVLVEQSAGIG
jgi:hypothetical protein